jgi:hypothetical protein
MQSPHHATDPYLTDILLGGLESWLNNVPFDVLDLPPEYQILMNEQNQIGWVHVFQGRILMSWQRPQQRVAMGCPGPIVFYPMCSPNGLPCGKPKIKQSTAKITLPEHKPDTPRQSESSEFSILTATKSSSETGNCLRTISNHIKNNPQDLSVSG